MERYLVFAGQQYYSVGGGCDFVDSFNSIEKAIDYSKRLIGLELSTFDKEQFIDCEDDCVGSITVEWSHVFDNEKRQIVKENGIPPIGRGAVIVKPTKM